MTLGAPLVTVHVRGRPATYSTAAEPAWKDAVRQAVTASGCTPVDARFAVDIAFTLPTPTRRGEAWDLDNLIKTTLDAMEGVFGFRDWRGHPQAADDLVDEIHATKRTASPGEETGAIITTRTLGPTD